MRFPLDYGELFERLELPLPEGIDSREPVCLDTNHNGKIRGIVYGRPKRLWGKRINRDELLGDDSSQFAKLTTNQWRELGVNLNKVSVSPYMVKMECISNGVIGINNFVFDELCQILEVNPYLDFKKALSEALDRAKGLENRKDVNPNYVFGLAFDSEEIEYTKELFI